MTASHVKALITALLSRVGPVTPGKDDTQHAQLQIWLKEANTELALLREHAASRDKELQACSLQFSLACSIQYDHSFAVVLLTTSFAVTQAAQ